MSQTDEKAKKTSIEKYKVLFDFYRSEFDSLRGEYYKVEDKASKYLTSLSVLSGVFLLLFKDVVDNFIFNFMNSIVLLLIVISAASFAASWRFIFMTMKPVELKSIPFNKQNIDYFDNQELDTFYYSMANQYVEIIESYKLAISHKTSFLTKAFNEVKCSGLLLLILLAFIFTVKILA